MVRLEGGLTLAMFKSVMEKQICPWANEHLGKSWYLWMDSAGNAHGRDPSKPGGKAVRKIVHRLTGGRAEILEPPSYSPDLNVIENFFGQFKPRVHTLLARSHGWKILQ